MTEGRGPAGSVEPPADDADVPRFWRELGLPGLVDVHVHFLPDGVQAKVWEYFAAAETHYGAGWPITYAMPVEDRLAVLDRLGVRAFPTLPYPHKPGMAAWLNEWSAEFSHGRPQVLQSATFYPEPEAAGYVGQALERGVRVFKVHVQVGRFDPRDPFLDGVWARLEESGTPVVIHCGSGPLVGEHTGPAPVTGLLERYPRLQLVVAHLGMPEYAEFLDLAERYERVHLDTTMFATDFTERLMPFDPALRPRLGALRNKVILGSDFPSIPYAYAHQLTALHRLDLGEEWLRAVLWENGARLFRGDRLMPGFRLTAAVLGTPDPRGLARFYQRLLGWPIRDDEEDWATLRPADGGTGLSFQLETDHVPPVWPAVPGTRQMQVHLDIEVDDLPAACAVAEEAGARRIGGYDDPHEVVRIYADPAGHPFCLFVRT